jgi:hypothetical protein
MRADLDLEFSDIGFLVYQLIRSIQREVACQSVALCESLKESQHETQRATDYERIGVDW